VIGADLIVLVFGLGLMALGGLMGRVAIQAARATRRNQTILFGVGTVVAVLVGLYFVALAVLRLIEV
jgi:t-SNARE complex subunit (syntaxin)